MPMRNLIVTGISPAFCTAARTMFASSRGFAGIAEPPPFRVTLGTGQPKFMSMWSTCPSPTSHFTASPT